MADTNRSPAHQPTFSVGRATQQRRVWHHGQGEAGTQAIWACKIYCASLCQSRTHGFRFLFDPLWGYDCKMMKFWKWLEKRVSACFLLQHTWGTPCIPGTGFQYLTSNSGCKEQWTLKFFSYLFYNKTWTIRSGLDFSHFMWVFTLCVLHVPREITGLEKWAKQPENLDWNHQLCSSEKVFAFF